MDIGHGNKNFTMPYIGRIYYMKKKTISNQTIEVLMISPALIFYIIFLVVPLIGGIYYSFTNWDGIQNHFEFIGIKNYITLFKDDYVRRPLINSLVYAIVTMIGLNVLALVFAIGLDRKIRSKNLLRACMFLPALLSPLVVGYIFSFIFSEPVAQFGKFIGNEVLSNNILGNVNYSLWAAIIASIWRMTGWYMVVYLAGLQTIPKDLYEAADVEGIKSWDRFIKITFPLIAQSFTINMILSVERALKEFDLVFSLTNGGPGNSSELIALTIYRESFGNHRTGYGSALGVVLFILIVIISLVQMIWLRKREENTIE